MGDSRHRGLALRAAEEGSVLLQNQRATLPLKADGSLRTGNDAFLAQTDCLDLYLGFPAQQRVLVGFEVSRLPPSGGVCWFEDSRSAILTTERRCPDGATPMETREAVFGRFTDRYTVYIARN